VGSAASQGGAGQAEFKAKDKWNGSICTIINHQEKVRKGCGQNAQANSSRATMFLERLVHFLHPVCEHSHRHACRSIGKICGLPGEKGVSATETGLAATLGKLLKWHPAYARKLNAQ
jgi:hypothetical protein